MITNLWNTFLDTTPRQWARALAPTGATIAWALSLTVHAAAFSALFVVPGHRLAALQGETVEITLQPSRGIADADPAFDDSSDIVIRVPKHLRDRLASRLLHKYANMHVSNGGTEQQPNVNWQSPRAELAAPTIKTVDLKSSLATSPKSKATEGFSRDEISRELARYQPRFRACYEKALLADSSLNGKVQFVFTPGPLGEITQDEVIFEGVGRPDTRQELQTCLHQAMLEIRLPLTLAEAFGRSIQFQAVLSL